MASCQVRFSPSYFCSKVVVVTAVCGAQRVSMGLGFDGGQDGTLVAVAVVVAVAVACISVQWSLSSNGFEKCI
jgi:hypothetical protein